MTKNKETIFIDKKATAFILDALTLPFDGLKKKYEDKIRHRAWKDPVIYASHHAMWNDGPHAFDSLHAMLQIIKPENDTETCQSNMMLYRLKPGNNTTMEDNSGFLPEYTKDMLSKALAENLYPELTAKFNKDGTDYELSFIFNVPEEKVWSHISDQSDEYIARISEKEKKVMVTVQFGAPCARFIPNNNNYDADLIKVENITDSETDNWGDDDCRKMVTLVHSGDILIDKSIANEFDNAPGIQFLRWGYYNPAYYIDPDSAVTKETLADGTLVFHIRRQEKKST